VRQALDYQLKWLVSGTALVVAGLVLIIAAPPSGAAGG
jgi:hypothetical protein